MVAPVALHDMHQDRDEPVRSFCARLMGQANICNYSVECPDCKKDVSCTNHIVSDCITRCLSDDDICLDVLMNESHHKTFDSLVSYIESKEAGKRSISWLTSSQGAKAARSHYQKQRSSSVREKMVKCIHCGEAGHGNGFNKPLRKEQCPAYGQTCQSCTQEASLLISLQIKKQTKPQASNTARTSSNSNDTDGKGAVYDSLCSIASDSILGLWSDILDHHLYDNMCDRWSHQPSKPQPFINLEIATHREDYQSLGFTLTSRPGKCTISGMADTGCQSCLCGLPGMNKLDISRKTSSLSQCRCMQPIKHPSAYLELLSSDRQEEPSLANVFKPDKSSVTDNVDKLFISCEECISLGMISENFPSIGEAASLITSSKAAICDCPRCTLSPPRHTNPRCPPTEENIPRIKQYLMDYYRSTTFNTCEHQPLPLMEGPPMKLMIEENAMAVAHHIPVPVPIHWQERVNPDIERDVALGVLVPVPIGEPATWCHRMVICAKKNGQPPRTVDFQPLNKYATRETHHTQSPFLEARAVPCNMKKTMFDAWNGYHSVLICEDDRHPTTFITPGGATDTKLLQRDT